MRPTLPMPHKRQVKNACDGATTSRSSSSPAAQQPAGHAGSAPSRAPRRARGACPLRRTVVRCVLVMASLVAMVMMGRSLLMPSRVSEVAMGGTVTPLSATATTVVPRAEVVHARSLVDLRSVCAVSAPELAKSTWARHFTQTNHTFFLHTDDGENEPFAMLPYPVCVHHRTGLLFAEEAEARLNSAMDLIGKLPYKQQQAHFYDINELFAPQTVSESGELSTMPTVNMTVKRASVRVIPAMAMIPFGSFISTHMWHLINDALGRFAKASHMLNGELWRMPRQAVLTDEQGERWLDRNGDTPHKMRLTAAILNGFSTFMRLNDSHIVDAGSEAEQTEMVPAFSDTPLVVRVEKNVTLQKLVVEEPDFAAQTVCFCQATFIPVYPYRPPVPPRDALVTIQDRTALSFGAPPYRPLSQESVWAIERQRVERYPPWARQFWPSSGTSSDYQPRVLFIHRVRRTIANVSTYVTAMREMDFRVEEAYLERLPTEQQYYLGRYADVVVGMHGLGMGHALWMNRYPTGCRTVIEFRLWAGAGIPVGLESVLRKSALFHYVVPEPIDVIFGPTVKDPLDARQRIKDMGHGGFQHPGWDDQEAVFNITEVVQTFQDVKLHLSECLVTEQRPH